jgi:hypothetical protein
MYLEEDPDLEGRFAGALLFVRWSPEGDQPVGHLETEHLATGRKRSDVTRQLGALTLHEVKNHLERLIATKQEPPDW